MNNPHPNFPPRINKPTIRDTPLTKEQIKLAQHNLDQQRFQDNELFQQFQQFQQPLQPPFNTQNYYPPIPMHHTSYTYQPNAYQPTYQNTYIHQPNMQPNMQPNISITPPIPMSPPVPDNVLTSNNNFWSEPPLPEFLDPQKSIDLKLIRKTRKKDTRCYTCKPRGKVKKHMINTSESGLFVFSHDMHKRPVIIMTPTRHIETINEMTQEELVNMYKSIQEFAKFWNIEDYQISFNVGKWQNHDHFHCKIRISEKILARMRRDHFQLIKLDSNYVNKPIANKQ